MLFDWASLQKYLLEGLAVAVAAYLIPRRKLDLQEIAIIALTAAAIFAVLDYWAPEVGHGTRQGAGFGIGMNTVGASMGVEGMQGYQGMQGQEQQMQQMQQMQQSQQGAGCGYSHQGSEAQVEAFDGFSPTF